MIRKYELSIYDRPNKRLVRIDSWGVAADLPAPLMDAEALEQLGKRLIAEAKFLRRAKAAA
jgi:hypothetical protein